MKKPKKIIIDRSPTLEETRRSFRMSRRRFKKVMKLVDQVLDESG